MHRQTLTKFEDATGVEFTHIRLLARSFTDRSLGLSNLTLGSNQRMEFLGDTVLQLITSDYLYRHFPDHHEGHLSLLRSSVVNNRTQAVVADDLGMVQYALYSTPKSDLKVFKNRTHEQIVACARYMWSYIFLLLFVIVVATVFVFC